MVAPTRTPQARGVKCDLCKKILASATWLDQNNLAKSIKEATDVLKWLKEHDISTCPCIPKNIQNLLEGSTHFEVHRLSTRDYDSQIHSKLIQRCKKATVTSVKETINDCVHHKIESRFKISNINSKEYRPHEHLKMAIDEWKNAMEDQANPFNSKLALRLGLTHHVIYACYYFKFYKLLDYQLTTANLLLNLFKTTEGVTVNAISHAYFLLIRSLLDCDQIQLAKEYLKQAIKLENFKDKRYYESILLSCVSCELNLLDGQNDLNDLAELANIRPEDKLQHYFARTMAISTVIKYIHCCPARSNHCFEFFHTYRFICAIIRRCYESSFELVLYDKKTHNKTNGNSNPSQILDHSWIKPAVCDLVFNTFEMVHRFYSRCGMPEVLELLYSGLELISCRTGNHYWQAKLASIGSSLDNQCDKFNHSKTKLDALHKIIECSQDQSIRDLIALEMEMSSLDLKYHCNELKIDEVELVLQTISSCSSALNERLHNLGDLYDSSDRSSQKLIDNFAGKENSIIKGRNFLIQTLTCMKLRISLLLRNQDTDSAKHSASLLSEELFKSGINNLDFDGNHEVLEILTHFVGVEKSLEHLLVSVFANQASLNPIFLAQNDGLDFLQAGMSTLTLQSTESTMSTSSTSRKRNTNSKGKNHRSLIRRKKGTYLVSSVEHMDTFDALNRLSSLTPEEILDCYLRNSEPNPHYMLYRRVHETLFSVLLRDSPGKYAKKEERGQLLYHFLESCSATTMRYRWMMFDEQHIKPYEPLENRQRQTPSKLLSFVSSSLNSFNKETIPENYQLIQIKHILSKENREEYLLLVVFDNDVDPIYVLCHKPLMGDNFLDDAKVKDENIQTLSLPIRFSQKIEEAKKTLFLKSASVRSDTRQRLETEIKLLLHALEEAWIGQFKFLLAGKVADDEYIKQFVEPIMDEIDKHIRPRYRHPDSEVRRNLFRVIIENAPILSREEFCRLIGIVFERDYKSPEVHESFNKWTRSIETFVSNKDPKLTKLAYFQRLSRSQVGLILDKELEHIPFESLPISQILKQGIFRVPSLRLFHTIVEQAGFINKRKIDSVLDPSQTAYILDPLSNLAKTRERFEKKLRSQRDWVGVIGEPPKTEHLHSWLAERRIYLYIGHGAGTALYNQLCKSRGLSAMQRIKAAALVMGCSSGRVSAEGPRLESFGINWVFIMRGSPAYVGILWDVTDTDIDRFFDSLLTNWMDEWMLSSAGDMVARSPMPAITEAIAQSRNVCQLKLLVGSAPVVYGLPVSCKQHHQTQL